MSFEWTYAWCVFTTMNCFFAFVLQRNFLLFFSFEYSSVLTEIKWPKTKRKPNLVFLSLKNNHFSKWLLSCVGWAFLNNFFSEFLNRVFWCWIVAKNFWFLKTLFDVIFIVIGNFDHFSSPLSFCKHLYANERLSFKS